MTGKDGYAAGTLGGWLEVRRRHQFVDREAELDLFRGALDADDPGFRVLFVYGPGGVGKTALLEEYAAVAADAGAWVVKLDGRDVEGTPHGVLEAVAEELGGTTADGALSPPSGERLVLLVDGYEFFSAMDAWFRERFLPRMPATSVTVIASLLPPRPDWRADAAWSELLRVVSLRNLGRDDAQHYLDRRGVPPEPAAGGGDARARTPIDPVIDRRRTGPRT